MLQAIYRWLDWRRNQKLYNQMTRTGETVGERKAYHDRGELSPGEHSAAQAIRERLKALGWIDD